MTLKVIKGMCIYIFEARIPSPGEAWSPPQVERTGGEGGVGGDDLALCIWKMVLGSWPGGNRSSCHLAGSPENTEVTPPSVQGQKNIRNHLLPCAGIPHRKMVFSPHTPSPRPSVSSFSPPSFLGEGAIKEKWLLELSVCNSGSHTWDTMPSGATSPYMTHHHYNYWESVLMGDYLLQIKVGVRIA